MVFQSELTKKYISLRLPKADPGLAFVFCGLSGSSSLASRQQGMNLDAGRTW